MPKYRVRELREKLAEDDPNEEIIAIVWQRSDFPNVWDRIAAAYDDDWNVELVNATGDALEARCKPMGIDLLAENPGGERVLTVRVMVVKDGSHAQYCEETADYHGFTASVWSIGGVMFGQPHPYRDADVLIYDTHEGWGGPDRIEVPIPGPKWLDLWRAAELALRESADKHHRFIESFVPDGTMLHLHCGS